jgi:hypothetical protein
VDGGENVNPAVGPDEGQVVAALERYVLLDGDRVEGSRTFDDSFYVTTSYEYWYEVMPAEWLLAGEAWVRAALRVVERVPSPGQPARTVGFVFDRAGGLLHLNDVAAVRALGRRLGTDLDPLAYAEILAEFYSVPEIDRPVVTAWAPGPSGRAGWLVRDVAAAAAKIPWVDPALLTPPVVRPSGDGIAVEFVSWHQTFGIPLSVDVLHWTVNDGRGQEPSWSRRYLALGVEMP